MIRYGLDFTVNGNSEKAVTRASDISNDTPSFVEVEVVFSDFNFVQTIWDNELTNDRIRLEIISANEIGHRFNNVGREIISIPELPVGEPVVFRQEGRVDGSSVLYINGDEIRHTDSESLRLLYRTFGGQYESGQNPLRGTLVRVEFGASGTTSHTASWVNTTGTGSVWLDSDPEETGHGSSGTLVGGWPSDDSQWVEVAIAPPAAELIISNPPQGGEVFSFSGSNYSAQPTGPMTFTQGTRTISRAVTISNWNAEDGSFTGVTDTALPGVPAAGASDTPALLYGEPVTISLPDPGA